MKEVSKASILAIPCEKVPYGVGYTNEIEALPFYIPILVTHNEYAHLHVEKKALVTKYLSMIRLSGKKKFNI